MPRVSAVDRREHFIAATVDVIAEHGVDGATTRKIADKAGAPLAALHYVFASKAELFGAVYEELYTILQQRIAVVRGTRPGLVVTATTVLREIMEWMAREPEFCGASIELLAWARRHGEPDMGVQAYERPFEAIEEVLEAGRLDNEDPSVVPLVPPLILAYCDGFVLQWLTYGQGRDHGRDIDLVVSTLSAYLDQQLAVGQVSDLPRRKAARMQRTR